MKPSIRVAFVALVFLAGQQFGYADPSQEHSRVDVFVGIVHRAGIQPDLNSEQISRRMRLATRPVDLEILEPFINQARADAVREFGLAPNLSDEGRSTVYRRLLDQAKLLIRSLRDSQRPLSDDDFAMSSGMILAIHQSQSRSIVESQEEAEVAVQSAYTLFRQRCGLPY